MERGLQVAIASSVTARATETQVYQKRPVYVKRDLEKET